MYSRVLLTLVAVGTITVAPLAEAAIGPAGGGQSAHSSPVYLLALASHNVGHNDWAYQGGFQARISWAVTYVVLGLFWLAVALWMRHRTGRAPTAGVTKRLWLKTLGAAWGGGAPRRGSGGRRSRVCRAHVDATRAVGAARDRRLLAVVVCGCCPCCGRRSRARHARHGVRHRIRFPARLRAACPGARAARRQGPVTRRPGGGWCAARSAVGWCGSGVDVPHAAGRRSRLNRFAVARWMRSSAYPGRLRPSAQLKVPAANTIDPAAVSYRLACWTRCGFRAPRAV